MIHAWMEENFSRTYAEEMAETVHVTGSPYSDIELDPADFAVLDEVWKVAWDHDAGTIPPRPITDRAIELCQDRDPAWLLVHYMQPHHPFLGYPELDRGQSIDDFQNEEWNNVWGKLRDDEVSEERVWTAYRDNLRAVLDDVELLLHNIDAERVMITSDYGNSFGKWGIYGHPMHMPLQCLREILWVEASATDTSSYTPEFTTGAVDDDVSRRLEQLGYK